MARGFDDVPDSNGYDSVRLEEMFDMFLPSKDANGSWVKFRLLPLAMLPIKTHWVKILTKKGSEVEVPKVCVSFNPDNQSEPLEGRKCPYCKLDHTKDTGNASATTYYYLNAIIRDEQDNEPSKKKPMTKEEQKTGFKDINSKSWTPVRVIQLTGGLARRIKDMKQGNMVKGVAYTATDAKYGFDIQIKYNPKASGEAKYSIEKTERTPLTEDELSYLNWNLDEFDEIYDKLGRLDTASALRDFKTLKVRGGDIHDDDEAEDEDDDGEGYTAKKKKPAGKAKRKPVYDEEEEDDDDDIPPSKKKPAAKKKSKFADDDEDDEDEDDVPPPKKKPAGKAKRKPVDDEEEDDDDIPPPKKKPAGKAKKKPVYDEEEDEDDDDDVPPPKKKPAAKKKSRFEDDDD